MLQEPSARGHKSWVYKQGQGGDAGLWSLDLIRQTFWRHGIRRSSATRPISIHNLAAWCYRTMDLADHAAAIQQFINEFHLQTYGLAGNSFHRCYPRDASRMAAKARRPSRVLLSSHCCASAGRRAALPAAAVGCARSMCSGIWLIAADEGEPDEDGAGAATRDVPTGWRRWEASEGWKRPHFAPSLP